MVVNLVKTIKSGSIINSEESEAPAREILPSKRMIGETPHRWIERKAVHFSVVVLLAVAVGGAVEIIPMITVKTNIPTIVNVKPYSPLELEGRDIYIKEGCYNCHSQMVRPFRWETERYGEYSKEGEFVYDHPFQWGSKRTGPDLARSGVVGGKMYRSAAWHYQHMLDPQKMFETSLMPAYPWLIENDLDYSLLKSKIKVMQSLGVPYPVGYAELAESDLLKQAQEIADELKAAGVETKPNKEIIAIIAYLHKLGKDISYQPVKKSAEKVVIENNFVVSTNKADLEAGKEIFAKTCNVCHGANGEGNAIGPNLTDNFWIHGGTDKNMFSVVSEGVPLMPGLKSQYNQKQLEQVVSFVISKIGSKPTNPKASQGVEVKR